MTEILPQLHHCDCEMCEWLNFGNFFKFPCIVRIYAWFFMHCRNHHSDNHTNHVINCISSFTKFKAGFTLPISFALKHIGAIWFEITIQNPISRLLATLSQITWSVRSTQWKMLFFISWIYIDRSFWCISPPKYFGLFHFYFELCDRFPIALTTPYLHVLLTQTLLGLIYSLVSI